jgi:hypothetical protein
VSLAIPAPVAVTRLRFLALVIVAGAVGAAQLNDVPSGQTAWNCTLAVGSGSSLSGDSKSRVLRTNSVACTVEPSSHWCGTAQKASAVSSKKRDRWAAVVADVASRSQGRRQGRRQDHGRASSPARCNQHRPCAHAPTPLDSGTPLRKTRPGSRFGFVRDVADGRGAAPRARQVVADLPAVPPSN